MVQHFKTPTGAPVSSEELEAHLKMVSEALTNKVPNVFGSPVASHEKSLAGAEVDVLDIDFDAVNDELKDFEHYAMAQGFEREE